MNSKQLEYFLAVAQCGGFTAAARRLHISQPALSTQLHLLEEELGAPLLIRRPHGVILTPEGRKLAEKALEVSRIIRDIPAEVTDIQHDVSGDLNIACGPYFAGHFMPDLLKRLLARYPGIRPRIREADTNMREAMFRDGTADIGIGAADRSRSRDFHPIFDSDIVLIRSVHSDLAGKKHVTKKDIAERRLICYSQDSVMYDVVCRILAPYRPNIFMDSRHSVTIIDLVREDFGLALVPDYLIDRDRRSGLIVGGFDSGERLSFGYCCAPGRPLTPPTRAFIDVIREKFALDSL